MLGVELSSVKGVDIGEIRWLRKQCGYKVVASQLNCGSKSGISSSTFKNGAYPRSKITLNIIIAGESFSFPIGLGATARVYAYARGFIENGARVKVFC